MGESKHWVMDWTGVEAACHSLVESILDNQPRDRKIGYILAVGKGGIIPAGLIWQKFPKAQFGIVQIKAYGDEGRLGRAQFHSPIPDLAHSHGRDTLVVDDICDSGMTFEALRPWLPHAQYAAMLRRENCPFKTTYSSWVAPKGEWVDFPWERKEDTELAF